MRGILLRRAIFLRTTLAGIALGGACEVNAQWSGSVALVSDYRYRGVSLSDERPAAQAAATYDHASGAYAGLFLSSVRFAGDGARGLQTLAHAGYARRLGSSLAADAGITYSTFTRPRTADYAEYHVGVADTRWSARAFFAPRYFGGAYSAAYAELNVTPLREGDLVPLFHVGVLRASVPRYYGPRYRWDGRVGLAFNRDLYSAQLSWGSASHENSAYGRRQDKSAWALRLTRWF